MSFASKAEENKQPIKENFRVELDVAAQKMDNFTVFYTETGKDDYSPDKAVWNGVKGGSIEEHLAFDLPAEIIPTNIRLDFGISEDRADVVLKKVKFIFYENSFEIKGAEFFNYFIKSDQIPSEINPADASIKFIKIPTRKEGTYFYPRKELLDKIAQITKETK